MRHPLTESERRTPLLQLGAERMAQAFDELLGPDPLYVACPYCKVAAGGDCTDRASGLKTLPHPTRYRASQAESATL